LKFRRQRFQRGSLRRVARANNKSAWEYRYQDPITDQRKSMFLSTALESTFSAVLDRFLEEEKLLEIKQLRPGDRCDLEGELSYSTASSYLSVIKLLRAKW
jgi:integrase